MFERSEFANFSIVSQCEICFLENLNSCERLFYLYLLLHYYKHLVLMHFLTYYLIKYQRYHKCCNAVQKTRGCYTTLKTKVYKSKNVFSFQLTNFLLASYILFLHQFFFYIFFKMLNSISQ